MNESQGPVGPSPTGADIPHSPEERREYLEEAMGGAITNLFKQYSDYAGSLRQGGEALKLYLPSREDGRRHPIIRVSQVTDEAGNRSAYLSYLGKGWHNHFRFTDGPDGNPRFEECRRDSATGKLTVIEKPRPSAENPNPYDHTADDQVAWWAEIWLRNLHEATPIKPRGTLAQIGHTALSALRKRG